MCTVSVVPIAQGFRLACNRDELRSRPRAVAPSIHPSGSSTGIWPVDPASGGTWIGTNDFGLTLVVLNRNRRVPGPAGSVLPSRGTIIPQLLLCRSLETAISAAVGLNLARFAPLTLVALQHRSAISITTGDSHPVMRTHDLRRPHLFTSSSLGDQFVAAPRGALFAELVHRSDDWIAGQAIFHGHRWPERPEISVRMSRADALTVSITTVDITSRRIVMRYTDFERES